MPVDFVGKWNMTESEAKQLVYRTVAKFNHPTNLVHFEVTPQVSKPALPSIPRYMFYWHYSREGEDIVRSAISAEVDADKGELKSLYYGDIAFGNNGPKIDIPILLPLPPDTNATSTKASTQTKVFPKPPSRPLTPYGLPAQK